MDPAYGCRVSAPVTARACANIALVKYWGKRDALLNLPAEGSLSLSLAGLLTETTVQFVEGLAADELILDGVAAKTGEAGRVSEFLDIVRSLSGVQINARVTSRNSFPTASGLASSASGFAALALAATQAAGLELDGKALSRLARRGSGSAARSIFGGFVRMYAGIRDEDAYAEPLASPLVDSVRMVVAVIGGGAPKSHGSRDAMDHTAATSPLYRGWLDTVPKDLATAEAALAAGDLEKLGTLAEANAFAMHASAIAARPSVMYWRPATLAVIAEIQGLRACGMAAWCTMDAGPHVKVLTTEADAPTIAMRLRDLEGVTAVTITGAGPAAIAVDPTDIVTLPPPPAAE